MATISWTVKAGYTNPGGLVHVDDFRDFNVGQALIDGGGTITADASDTRLVVALDSHGALQRSGSSSSPAPVGTVTGPIVVSRSTAPSSRQVPELQTDGSWLMVGSSQVTLQQFMAQQVPVWSHRGQNVIAPEHTVQSFEQTIAQMTALGAVPAIRVSLVLLGDGSVGVMHDPTLDRTTNSSGAASKHTAQSWRQVAINMTAPASITAQNSAAKQTQSPGPAWTDTIHPPLLTDVLDRFGGRCVWLFSGNNLACTKAALAEVTRRNLNNTVCWTGEDYQNQELASVHGASIPYIYFFSSYPLAGQGSGPATPSVATVLSQGYDYIAVSVAGPASGGQYLDTDIASAISAAHTAGKKVFGFSYYRRTQHKRMSGGYALSDGSAITPVGDVCVDGHITNEIHTSCPPYGSAALFTLGATITAAAGITTITASTAVTYPTGTELLLPNGQVIRLSAAASATTTLTVGAFTAAADITTGGKVRWLGSPVMTADPIPAGGSTPPVNVAQGLKIANWPSVFTGNTGAWREYLPTVDQQLGRTLGYMGPLPPAFTFSDTIVYDSRDTNDANGIYVPFCLPDDRAWWPNTTNGQMAPCYAAYFRQDGRIGQTRFQPGAYSGNGLWAVDATQTGLAGAGINATPVPVIPAGTTLATGVTAGATPGQIVLSNAIAVPSGQRLVLPSGEIVQASSAVGGLISLNGAVSSGATSMTLYKAATIPSGTTITFSNGVSVTTSSTTTASTTVAISAAAGAIPSSSVGYWGASTTIPVVANGGGTWTVGTTVASGATDMRGTGVVPAIPIRIQRTAAGVNTVTRLDTSEVSTATDTTLQGGYVGRFKNASTAAAGGLAASFTGASVTTP